METSAPAPSPQGTTPYNNCHSPQTHFTHNPMTEGMSCTPMQVHRYIHYVHHCSQCHTTPLACNQRTLQEQQQPAPLPPLHAPWGHQSFVTQWVQHTGWQPSSQLPTAVPGHNQLPLALIPCPYNHQCQHAQVLTCKIALNSTSAHQGPAQSETSSDKEPHNDNEFDKGVEVLTAAASSNRILPDGQRLNATDPGGPSTMTDEIAALEEQEKQERQERLERRRKAIYEARRKSALEKNIAAFDIVHRRYMLPSGQPMLKILRNGKEVASEEDEGQVTDYDSDEDGGEDINEDAVTQRYNDFVQAVGCCQPLDTAERTILSNYLDTYLLRRCEYAGGRRLDMRGVRNSMAEKILLSIKNQKRTPETWTWSSRNWSREMNKAILHHKKTDSYWKARAALLDDRLAESWQENVEGARRDLDSRVK
ncbi:hypothetical protein BGZ88_008583 [Linnemannia elongata]|nr:hypothetical protein BGZ88_008583 [Linnemannia elongata]